MFETLDPNLIKKIIKKSRRRLRKKTNILFGDITGDVNPIHRDKKEAVKLEFKETPIIGAYASAIAIETAMRIYKINTCEDPTRDISFSETSFKNPLYPSWRAPILAVELVSKFEDNHGFCVRLNMLSKNIINLENETQFNKSLQYKGFDKVLVPDITTNLVINQNNIERYCGIMGVNYSYIPPGLSQSYIPAMLTRILKKAYEEEGNMLLPINVRMSTWFYSKVEVGKCNMVFKWSEQLKKRGVWLSYFSAHLYQNNTEKIATKILCMSKEKIDEDKISRIRKLETIVL